jgi:hypothetical protein
MLPHKFEVSCVNSLLSFHVLSCVCNYWLYRFTYVNHICDTAQTGHCLAFKCQDAVYCDTCYADVGLNPDVVITWPIWLYVTKFLLNAHTFLQQFSCQI